MGMGEPLMNIMMKAIWWLSSEGLGMSPKRIMVSTSGVPKWLKLADDDVKVKLAVHSHRWNRSKCPQ
jgi:23S rRNA (adenine2503-C2)-methyltransferase